ncbi:MAG: iron transporter FeoA [Rubrivivax sp. SCN 70-15]|nr:MAG: iron transporter FeoA [Rubrivivax sp. SCN 70-15]
MPSSTLPKSAIPVSAPGPASTAPVVPALDRAAIGQACRVVAVHAPEGAPDWGRWLSEIGFLPGERVTVTARSVWGGDPMVVRVGQSTFALRRAEAACVEIEAL